MGKAIKINDISFLDNLGTVTFVESVQIPIVGLSISIKPTTIENQYQLQAVFDPVNTTQKSIVWSSSNTSVATVSASGLVTVISAGTVTITVKSSVDDTLQDSFTASCSIEDIPVSSVEIVGSTVGEVGKTTQLSITVLPANATNKSVIWSSSDGDKASVNSSGLVTFIAIGTVTITATSVADNTKTGTLVITVNEQQQGIPSLGLKVSLDASSESPSSTVWHDQSGNGYDFILENFDYEGNGFINGELVFNSTLSTRCRSNIPNGGCAENGDLTFIVKFKSTMSYNDLGGIYTASNKNNDGVNFEVTISANRPEFYSGGGNSNVAPNTLTGIHVPWESPGDVILIVRRQGTDVTINQYDKTGATKVHNATLPVGTLVTNDVFIGAKRHDIGSLIGFWNSSMSKILIYDRVLSDSDINIIKDIL